LSTSPLRHAQPTRNERRADILVGRDPKLQAFLEFVLGQYERQGVSELDRDKLADLLQLKYHTVIDATHELGEIPVIRDTFVGFQRLYLWRLGALLWDMPFRTASIWGLSPLGGKKPAKPAGIAHAPGHSFRIGRHELLPLPRSAWRRA
jgi:hypothetical protein